MTTVRRSESDRPRDRGASGARPARGAALDARRAPDGRPRICARPVAALALAGLLAALASPADAQDGSSRRRHRGGGQATAQPTVTGAARSAAHDAEARALFEAGTVAFREGRFAEALERYKRALELSGRPEMHYNVGAASDRAGLEAEALEAYERYLAAVPTADNRGFVEGRVAVLRPRVEAARAAAAAGGGSTPTPAVGATEGDGGSGVAVTEPASDATPPRADDPPAASAPPPDRGASALPGVLLLAGGGALGAAAVVTGVLALGAKSDLDAGCVQGVCDGSLRGRADDMRTFALLTDVLAGLGLAAAIGGVLYLVLSGGDDEARGNAEVGRRQRSLAVAPALGRDAAGLAVSGAF